MSTAKCATCNVQFENLTDMREHFQADWHSHNVKLRVDGKKPMTKASFKDAAHGEDLGASEDKPQFACTLCKKYFRSVQTLQSHVKSTEHLLKKEKRIIDRDSSAASALTATSLGSAALGLHRRARQHRASKYVDPLKNTNGPKVEAEVREDDVTETSCLFCGHKSKTVEANLSHLKRIHTFTIPMDERCKDVNGLMLYLARKVNGCMCLVCGVDSKHYATLEAVRAHMVAAQHEYIVLGPEYNEFYGDTLDDLTADVEAPKAEEGGMELIVTEGGKRVAKRRDGGMQGARNENAKKMEDRRLLTFEKNTSTALVHKERMKIEAPALKEERKRMLKFARKQQNWQMKMGVRSNMLHAKGYDGEGETN